MRLGKTVDLGQVRRGIDRAAHQDHRGRLGGLTGGREQRHRRQHRHRGLAHRHDMDLRSEETDKLDCQIDEIVEIESAEKQRDIPRVLPIGNKDVMVGQ